MKPEEAIRLIRNLLTMCEFTDAYGEPIDSDDYYDAVDAAISALGKQIPKNQKTYSPLRTLPDIYSQRVENVRVAEKPSNIIAIRGYATFVDKQLIGVIIIMSNDAISRQAAIDALENTKEVAR